MTSHERQITGTSNICSTVCSGQHLRKTNKSALLAGWPVDFPPKGTIMRNAIPWYDVIMGSTKERNEPMGTEKFNALFHNTYNGYVFYQILQPVVHMMHYSNYITNVRCMCIGHTCICDKIWSCVQTYKQGATTSIELWICWKHENLALEMRIFSEKDPHVFMYISA